MIFSGVAVAGVKSIALNDCRVWNLRLESLNHITRQNVRTVLFAGVELNCHLAKNILVNHLVKLDKVFSVDCLGEVNLSRRALILFAGDVL